RDYLPESFEEGKYAAPGSPPRQMHPARFGASYRLCRAPVRDCVPTARVCRMPWAGAAMAYRRKATLVLHRPDEMARIQILAVPCAAFKNVLKTALGQIQESFTGSQRLQAPVCPRILIQSTRCESLQ